MRGAKYIPPFPYQGRANVYLRFESFDTEELPRIATVEQVIDHPEYNEEYHIARMTRNTHADPSIDVILAIETGDPKRIHGSIQHFSALLIELGEQDTPPKEYYDPDYGWSLTKAESLEAEESSSN